MIKKILHLMTFLVICALPATSDAADLGSEMVYEDPKPETYSIDSTSLHNPFTPLTPIKTIIEKVEIKDPLGTLNFPFNTDNSLFQKPTETEIPLPTLAITGIVWNTDRPQAIINGQVADVGDNFQNATVVAIRKNEIDVQFNGKISTITL